MSRRAGSVAPGRSLLLATGAIVVAEIAVAVVAGALSVLALAAYTAADLLVSAAAAIDRRSVGRASRGGRRTAATEAILIVASAGVVGVSALRSLTGVVERPGVAAACVGVLAVGGLVVARRVERLALRSGAESLLRDALRLGGRAVSGAGVAATLLVVALTGVDLLDRIAALVVVVLTLRLAFELLAIVSSSVGPADDADAEVVRRLVAATGVLGPPRIRRRRTGGRVVVDIDAPFTRRVRPAAAREMWRTLHGELEAELGRPVSLRLRR